MEKEICVTGRGGVVSNAWRSTPRGVDMAFNQSLLAVNHLAQKVINLLETFLLVSIFYFLNAF